MKLHNHCAARSQDDWLLTKHLTVVNPDDIHTFASLVKTEAVRGSF